MMKATDSQVASLNDIHKDCLRLAIYHYSSKEIGKALGISRHTVDQRLRHAMQRLGASNRFEAARILADFEAQSNAGLAPHPFVYQPPYLSPSQPYDSESLSAGVGDGQADETVHRLQDAQTPFVFDKSRSQAPLSHPVSFMGVSKTGSSLTVKTLWALGIAIGSLFAFGAAVAGLEVLSRIQ